MVEMWFVLEVETQLQKWSGPEADKMVLAMELL